MYGIASSCLQLLLYYNIRSYKLWFNVLCLYCKVHWSFLMWYLLPTIIRYGPDYQMILQKKFFVSSTLTIKCWILVRPESTAHGILFGPTPGGHQLGSAGDGARHSQ